MIKNCKRVCRVSDSVIRIQLKINFFRQDILKDHAAILSSFHKLINLAKINRQTNDEKSLLPKLTLKGCPESTLRLITNRSGVIETKFPVPTKACLPEANSR